MGQENKPDNFCLAEKRSKALGDGALYPKIKRQVSVCRGNKNEL